MLRRANPKTPHDFLKAIESQKPYNQSKTTLKSGHIVFVANYEPSDVLLHQDYVKNPNLETYRKLYKFGDVQSS